MSSKTVRKWFWRMGGDWLLAKLLEFVRADGGFWPTERSMRAAHGTFSMWAPELVVTRMRGGKKEILLALYEAGVTEFFGMWHIPGGYNRTEDRTKVDAIMVGFGIQTLQPTVTRIGLREVGVDLRIVRVLDLYWWRRRERGSLFAERHPYGWPLSIYVECEPQGEINETNGLRFFPLDTIPQNTVAPHDVFILERLAKARHELQPVS